MRNVLYPTVLRCSGGASRLRRWRLFSVSLACAVGAAGCSMMDGSSGFSGHDRSSMLVDVRNSQQHFVDPEIERTSTTLRHFLMGQIALGNQEYSEATRHLEVASELSSEVSPVLHGTLAELYVRAGKLRDALSQIEMVRNDDPTNVTNLSLYAGTLEALGRDDEAEAVYKDLVARDPNRFDSYVLLSNLYNERKAFVKSLRLLRRFRRKEPHHTIALYFTGHVHELAGSPREAVKFYMRAYESDPQKTHAVKDIIRIHLQEGNAEAAEKFCRRVLKGEPDNVMARRVLSHMLLGEGKFEEALEQLQVLESVEADSTQTRFKIALIHLERQDLQNALTTLLLVIAAEEDHHEARFYLGSVYASMGEVDKALSELQQIPEDSEMFVKARTFTGFIHRQEGSVEKAAEAISRALKADPDNMRLMSYLVLLFRDQGKLEEARSMLDQRLRAEPENEELLFHYGIVLGDMGDKVGAFKTMEQVVRLNPQNADALNYVAYGLAEREIDLDRASNMINSALEENPVDPYYLDTKGWVLFKRGEIELAERTLEQASTLAPNDPVVLHHYATVLLQRGNENAAKNILNRIKRLSLQQSASFSAKEAKQEAEQLLGILDEE